MTDSEVAALIRAHQLFAKRPVPVLPGVAADPYVVAPAGTVDLGGGAVPAGYRRAAQAQRAVLARAVRVDRAALDILAAARADHTSARRQTASVVEEARADAVAADNPLAHREAMRRRAARLRAQRAHVLAARRRAIRHRDALRRLHYPGGRSRRNRGLRLPPSGSQAGAAVRAALSRLGRPYVWGATGPHQFDCSGLTQWSYAQAGVHLDRTTYQQIHQGIAVSRSQVRPGDLVFPTAGHVQLAIGNDRVIEAPHPGAMVRISPLGAALAIRRPLP